MQKSRKIQVGKSVAITKCFVYKRPAVVQTAGSYSSLIADLVIRIENLIWFLVRHGRSILSCLLLFRVAVISFQQIVDFIFVFASNYRRASENLSPLIIPTLVFFKQQQAVFGIGQSGINVGVSDPSFRFLIALIITIDCCQVCHQLIVHGGIISIFLKIEPQSV